ncbi:AI-2E family transporter [Litoreibacter janthinus]|uniref:Predicted PurR-regulated permease PerM n=1 Tax=Litoreibacter janthinus TaxID=670154 RepID=A0A1I6GBZ6_9RHOB|nr:AI-2E family transporter [Litoreibacter janthinus]SFR39734.1 Predicted PurR-regulated permease PerM [Litoreibacter janthinus]
MDDDLKSIRRSLVLLSVLAVFVVAYFARELVLPVMLGALIALTLSPANRALQRIGMSAGIGAALLMTGATLAIALAVFFASGTISEWTSDAPAIAKQLRQKLSGVNEALEVVKKASKDIEEMAGDTSDISQPVVVQPPTLLNSAVTIAASTLTTIGVALILALFLLASGDLFYRKLIAAFTSLGDKKRALSTVYDIERQVSVYLLTITLINAALGLSVTLALWALGLEYAYVWGIVAFLLNYLPVLGGIIGTLLVAAYAIVTFDSLSYALLAPLTYQVLTSSEAQFVTPYIVGRRMELNIVAVFLTVVLWGWLWGIAGAIVAVPFLLVFKVVCDHVESLKTFGTFLSPTDQSTGVANNS